VDIFLEVRIRPYNFATFIDLDSLLLQASKTQMIPKTLLNCFLGLMSGMRYGHTSTSCILGNVCSCAHCCTAANGRDGHTGLVYQTSTNHTFCVDSTLLCQGSDLCCTASCASSTHLIQTRQTMRTLTRCLASIHESANNLRSVIYTFVSGPDTISNGLSTIIGNTLHVARQKECLTGQRASLWLVMHTK